MELEIDTLLMTFCMDFLHRIFARTLCAASLRTDFLRGHFTRTFCADFWRAILARTFLCDLPARFLRALLRALLAWTSYAEIYR